MIENKELQNFLSQLDRDIRKGTPKKKIIVLIERISDRVIREYLLNVYLENRRGSVLWIKENLKDAIKIIK